MQFAAWGLVVQGLLDVCDSLDGTLVRQKQWMRGLFLIQIRNWVKSKKKLLRCTPMHDFGQEKNTGTKTTNIRCNIRYTVANRSQWTSNWYSNVGTEGCTFLRQNWSGRVILHSTIVMGYWRSIRQFGKGL